MKEDITEEVKELLELCEDTMTAKWNVENITSFDDFMDWLDIDIGLSKNSMLQSLLDTEKVFEKAGYITRAKLTRRKYEQLKNKIMKEERIITLSKLIHEEKFSENPIKIKIQKWQQEKDELLKTLI